MAAQAFSAPFSPSSPEKFITRSHRADIKTFTVLGTYAGSVITALTSQDTKGVHGVEAVSPDFVASQLQCNLSDIGCDAMKTGALAASSCSACIHQTSTGMLHNVQVIAAIVRVLRATYPEPSPRPPLVLDPVMVSTSGHTLLDVDAMANLRDDLIPLASVLTPNLPEALILAGYDKKERSFEGLEGMKRLVRELGKLGCRHVLLKGGHAEGDVLFDVLYDAKTGEEEVYRHTWVCCAHLAVQ